MLLARCCIKSKPAAHVRASRNLLVLFTGPCERHLVVSLTLLSTSFVLVRYNTRPLSRVPYIYIKERVIRIALTHLLKFEISKVNLR